MTLTLVPPSAGRWLACVRCGEHVLVVEIPAGFLDPRAYVCGERVERVEDTG